MASSNRDEFLSKIVLSFLLLMLVYLLYHYWQNKIFPGNALISNIIIKIYPFLLFNLASYVCGARILAYFHQNHDSFNYQIALALALGFVFYYLLAMVISLLHILSYILLWITVLVPLLVFWRKIWELMLHFARLARLLKIPVFSPALLLLLTLLLYLILALSPPCWNDPMAYHLVMPKEYLENGGVAGQTQTMMTYSPSGMHMLYLYLMGIGNDYLPKLQHFVFLLLTLYIVYYNIRALLTGKIAFYATLFFCCQWLIFHGVQRANVDFYYTFYALISFFLILNIVKTKQQNAIPLERSSLLMIGICLGAAVSSKYNSICHLAAIEVILVLLLFTKKITLKNLLVVNSLAVLVFLPCMLRNYIYTGDPLFWILSDKLQLYDVLSPVHLKIHPHMNDLVTPRATPFLFWVTPFYAYLYGRFPTTYFDAFIDPFYMLSLVLGILYLKRHVFLRYIYIYIVIYYCGWFFTNAMTRYMLPVVALLGLITIFLFLDLLEKSPGKFYAICQKIFLGIILVFCGGNLIYCATAATYYFGKNLAVFSGKMPREIFLKATNAGVVLEINQYLKKHGHPDDRIYMILYQSIYYLEYQALPDSLGGNLAFLKDLDDNGQDYLQWLRYHKYRYVLVDVSRYGWLHGPTKNQNPYLQPYEDDLAILHRSWEFLEKKLAKQLCFEKQFGYLLLYRVPRLDEMNQPKWGKAQKN